MATTGGLSRQTIVLSWRVRTQIAIWRHPEHWLVVAVVSAWFALAIQHLSSSGTAHMHHGFKLGSWSLMVIAMMMPGAIPMMRNVAFSSLWSRRHHAALLFVGVYFVMWVIFGLAISFLLGLAQNSFVLSHGRRPLLIMVGIVAIAWQFTRVKHRAMRRGHLRRHLGARGWLADLAVVRYSLEHGWTCMCSCWAIMLLMCVAKHNLYLMVLLSSVTIAEKLQTRPQGSLGAAVISFAVVVFLI